MNFVMPTILVGMTNSYLPNRDLCLPNRRVQINGPTQPYQLNDIVCIEKTTYETISFTSKTVSVFEGMGHLGDAVLPMGQRRFLS